MLLSNLLIAAATACTVAPTAQDPLARFSPDQRGLLERGEVLYHGGDLEKPSDKGGSAPYAAVVLQVPVETAYKVFLRFEEQSLYLPKKRVSRVLERSERSALLYSEYKFFMRKIAYTVRYRMDPERHRVEYELDASKPHDIEDTAGAFEFKALGPRQTLFVYSVTRLDIGFAVPGFVRSALSSRDLPEVARNVKKRIESGGTWRKDS